MNYVTGGEDFVCSGTLPGDLDWIVMRALEKDRNRRYQTASELAADVRRYLSHEVVLARPPGTVYRLRKFVRRHRVGVFVNGVRLGYAGLESIRQRHALAPEIRVP